MPIFSFIRYIPPELLGKNLQLKTIMQTNKFNFLYFKQCVSLKLGVKKKKKSILTNLPINHDI